MDDAGGTLSSLLPRVPASASRFDVAVPAEHRYEVLFECGLLGRYGQLFARRFHGRAPVIFTDTRVHRLFGRTLLRSFHQAGLEPGVITVPEGERSKSLATFCELLERMAELGVDRRQVLVNFGGGVITDLGGFLASAYMRGIQYVNLCTSLLAQLDAGIGGKVAVNTGKAKNFIGAFHHPSHVASDPTLLRTLSARDFRSGLAEAIKVAVIGSSELFERLERERPAIARRDPATLLGVAAEAARLKMDMIALDPYEKNLERPLNFGHTIGHPIETEFGYRKLRHGEAVAIGMAVATAIAVRKKILAAPVAERIYGLLAAHDLLDLPGPLRPDRVVEHLHYVRLVRAGQLHFVLPRTIGAVEITEAVSEADLAHGFEALNEMGRWNTR